MPDSDSGELVPADLAGYTQGRLSGNDPGTADALNRALAACRRFCGWHVAPVRTGTVTLDGDGSRLLVLPTLRLTALTSLIEDGVTLDVDTLEWSARGLVRKPNGGCWSGKFGAIAVTMSHGFDEAQDWQAAVLSFADRSSLTGTGGRPTVVGPFQYGTEAMAAGSAFSAAERALLEQYRLESQP
jgi:hypothetical protein